MVQAGVTERSGRLTGLRQSRLRGLFQGGSSNGPKFASGVTTDILAKKKRLFFLLRVLAYDQSMNQPLANPSSEVPEKGPPSRSNGVSAGFDRRFAGGSVPPFVHPAGFSAVVTLPKPRLTNAREALVMALAVIEAPVIATPAPLSSSPAVPPLPQVTPHAPAPAPHSLPAPAKAPALRGAGHSASSAVEVPAAPATKLPPLKEAMPPAPAPAPAPVPVAVSTASPIASASAPASPSIAAAPASAATPASVPAPFAKRNDRWNLATTAPFSPPPSATRPPMKLRVAVRPQSLEATPGAASARPAIPPVPPVPEPVMPTEAPLVPIRGLSGAAESRHHLAPLSSSTTPPMMMTRRSAATPVVNALAAAARATAPVAPVAAVSSSSSGNHWRVIGFLVPLAILGFVGYSVHKTNQGRKAALLVNEPAVEQPAPAAPIAPSTPPADQPSPAPRPDDKPAAPAPSPATPLPSEAPPPPEDPSALPATPPPGAVEPPPPVVRPAPSPEFIALLFTFKVSGVVQGNPMRAIINGRLFEEGDVVTEKLGVRLIGLDVESNNLIFEDNLKAQAKLRF